MGKLSFAINNRWNGAVQFTAEIECREDTPLGIKIGLAVRWAIDQKVSLADAYLADAYLARANLADANLARANLARANLAGADLARANLAGADLARANLARANLAGADLAGANLAGANLAGADLANKIIDGGLRSDGYRFLLTRTEDGPWRIKAGCRNFTVADAKDHWDRTRPNGDQLGDETRAIVVHMLVMARIQKWDEAASVEAETTWGIAA